MTSCHSYKRPISTTFVFVDANIQDVTRLSPFDFGKVSLSTFMADVDWSIHNFLDNYFSSPIRTLCESIKDSERQFQSISSHDVVEAYNVLCCRIRSRKDDVAGLHSPAFLSIFKDNSTLLVQRMSRDIRGVVANPFGSRLRHEELSMNQSYDLDCSPDEENLLDATNHTLCQYVLRLLSDIFIHPSLYSTLSRSCTL